MECRNCPDRGNCKRQCMDLPTGKTCNDCLHTTWCVKAYGVKRESTHCHFEPIQFKPAPEWLRRL